MRSQECRVPHVSFLRPGIARTLLRQLVFASLLTGGLFTSAQTADQAWLTYRSSHADHMFYPIAIRSLGPGPIEQSAVEELKRNLGPLADLSAHGPGLSARASLAFAGQTVLGTLDEVRKAFPSLQTPRQLKPDGYWIYANGLSGDQRLLVIAGAGQRGVLYGAFALLRLPATGQRRNLHLHPLLSNPALPIRWVDDWDNPDGSIERGYAGRSIFFEGDNVRQDLAPVAAYARLLASIGINGCNVNNVNAAPQLLDSSHLKGLARIADAMRPWGVRLAMSVDVASPEKIGGLATYDPADSAVKAWWAAKVNEIYSLIPDFAGFTVKADSEGQPGP
ncbi:MAG: alpha-glucuronidase family glycosyl hydrolase, partial [Terracidiphilus sp.]